jgi:hypothetical protein
MKKTTKLLSSLIITLLFTGSAVAEVRTWTDTSGRQVNATFLGLEGGNIVLQVADGSTHTFPLTKLSAEDQALAKTLKPAERPVTIDSLVLSGIQRANPERVKSGKNPLTTFNALASDEQFVRRVYLDIVGRIPNHAEASAFIKDSKPNKRAKLIDLLLDSPGYNSHMYNFVAEMLRVKDRLEGGNNIRGIPYINWLQKQISTNVTWDKMAFEMLTATGKMWHNGAAGYLLRDSGMPLDNLANTLAVFLGTDVACAQCHDHPFSDWTQRQFYEMASFFGATETRYRNQRKKGDEGMQMADVKGKIMPEIEKIVEKNGMDMTRLRNGIEQFINANRYEVNDTGVNGTKMPHDYKYPDAAPNSPVAPKLIKWAKDDGDLECYKAGEATAENPRRAFAAWATHPSNPRFAMAIANRMWKRAFGLGISEPTTNIDDPEQSANPELLKFLAEEMKRVRFDLKAFMRIIYNTRAYQAASTTEFVAMGEPYYFQGPLLRRMTAEQTWDSYMTLVLGEPDKYEKPLDDLYGNTIDLDLNNPKLDAQTVLMKFDAFRKMQQKEEALLGGGLAEAGAMEDTKKGKSKAKEAEPDMMMENASLSFGKLVLRRASELEQPAPNGHFLIDFGQSPRNIIDGSSKIGTVPQVLSMMNGQAQQMLTSSDSLIFRTMDKVRTPSERVEAMYLTVLSRRPTMNEKQIAQRAIGGGDDGYANMVWALINTREFIFVQ